MNNGLQALHSGLDERFEHIVADDRMVDSIIHTCITARREAARFPVRLVSIMVACAAVMLFTAATMLLNGGVIWGRQSQAPANQGVEPASAAITEGGGDVVRAIPMLVSLSPQLSENGLYGYVDSEGTFVIEPRFTAAEPFYGDRAVVEIDGQRAIIDIKGELIKDQP